jgi:hypothetical protein
MNVGLPLALAILFILGADQQGLMPFLPAPPVVELPDQTAPPSISQNAPEQSAPTQFPAHSSGPLRPQSRLLLIRYVSGEFGKLVQSLPGGRKGFRIVAGKPLNPQKLNDALRNYGIAASQGDTVQITALEIRSQEIVLQINGGGKKHFHLRQHLQIGIGNVDAVPPPTAGPPEIAGATLVLDYGRAVPDMSPDDLKRDLSVFFDFSKQHSATVNWVETLPPQIQDAIKDHRAVVGMDQEMVIAAMGRPEHKVREKSPEGNETEDWIYGSPPARTTFVTFAGDTVIRVREFN